MEHNDRYICELIVYVFFPFIAFLTALSVFFQCHFPRGLIEGMYFYAHGHG